MAGATGIHPAMAIAAVDLQYTCRTIRFRIGSTDDGMVNILPNKKGTPR